MYGVVFVFSYDPSDPQALGLYERFSRAADSLKLEATFAAISIANQAPALLKYELNRKVFSMNLSGRDGAESVSTDEFVHFVETHNHLLLNPIDKHNFRALGRTGKPLVIAVVDYAQEDVTAGLIVHLDEIASELDSHIAHSIVFGHMDGIKWRRYLAKFGVTVPGIFVMDLSVNGYYVTSKKDPLDAESIRAVVSGAVQKSLSYLEVESHDTTLTQRIVRKLQRYYPWSVILCALPLVFIVSSCLFPHPSSVQKKND